MVTEENSRRWSWWYHGTQERDKGMLGKEEL